MSSAFAERAWRSADGLTLYARDYAGADGEARLPIICLHGLTRNSKDFEDVAPRLAAGGRRVLVPDVRGRGRSDRDPKPSGYHPKVYARDVLGLMDALGMSRAVFVGTSMGGIITLMVSALRRSAIAAAILNDVGPEVDKAGLDRIFSYAGKTSPVESWVDAVAYCRTTAGAAFPGYSDAEWEAVARRTFHNDGGKPAFDYDPSIMLPVSKGPPKTRSMLAEMFFRRMARGRPTLLIRGELSDLLSEPIAAKMKRMAPAMETVVVPGVGHAPMLTEPEAVVAIDEFLARVP